MIYNKISYKLLRGEKSKNVTAVLYSFIHLPNSCISLSLWCLNKIFQQTHSTIWRKQAKSNLVLFWSPEKLASKKNNWGSFPHYCCQTHFFLKYPVKLHYHIAHGRASFAGRVYTTDYQLHILFHAFSCEATPQFLIDDCRDNARILTILHL